MKSLSRKTQLLDYPDRMPATPSLIDQKLTTLQAFVETLEFTSTSMEPAFQTNATGRAVPTSSSSTSTMAVSFRRKWYTYQEFYFQVSDKHTRSLAEEEKAIPEFKVGELVPLMNKSKSSDSSAKVSVAVSGEIASNDTITRCGHPLRSEKKR